MCTTEAFEGKCNGACLDEINIVCSKVERIQCPITPFFHFI